MQALVFIKNAAFKTVGEIFMRIFSFVFVVLVARKLGEGQFGLISLAQSFALLFVVIVDFGFNPLLVRDLARDPDRARSIFMNTLLLKIGLAGVFALTVWIARRLFLPHFQAPWVLAGMAAFAVLHSFTEFCNSVFQGRQMMQWEALTLAAQKVALLLFGCLALFLGTGVPGVALAYVIAGLSGLAAGIFLLAHNRLLTGNWRPDWQFMGYALRHALPLTLTTLFIGLYFRIDITLLAKLRTVAEVGWYGAAHKCIEVGMVLPAIVVSAAFPGFAKLFAEDLERFKRWSTVLLRLLLATALPMAALGFLLAEPLMVLLFGEAYRGAAGPFRWLMLALGCIFINYLFSYMLISANRQKSNALISGLAVVVVVLGNLWLIPRFGAEGAGMAAALTEGFLLVAYALAVRIQIGSLPAYTYMWRALLLAAVLTVGCGLTLALSLPWRLGVGIGVITLGLALTGILPKTEIKIMLSGLRERFEQGVG